MEDVKCRFFGTSGPTQISQILGNVDEAMASIKPKEDQYLPCLDPEGNKDGMKDGDTDIAKYAEVTIDTNFTGLKDKDGALNRNCSSEFSQLGEGTYKKWSAR